MSDQINIVVETLRSFWMQIAVVLPRLAAAILLLLVGWITTKFPRKAVIRILKLVRLDVAAEKAGIEDFLLQGGVRFTTVTLVATLMYWFVLFVMTLAALNSLGLHVAAELFNRIILYLPNVFVAIILLIFGSLFARFIQSVAYTYFSNIGIAGAKAMSVIAQYAILIFVISMALEQLAIGGQIMVSAFQIAFGALCLALALAFGLGGRDWAAQVLDKTRKKT
jgi:hypothetical protein